MRKSDAVEDFLGSFGKWQFRSTLLIYLVKIPSAWFMACLIFTAKSPMPGEIFCSPPIGIELNDTNFWINSIHKESFNRIENEESYDYCYVYQDAYLNYSVREDEATRESIPCVKFQHQTVYASIINQYELLCSREALVALSQSFHLLGVLIGGIIAFYMLKKCSPRETMLVGMISQIPLGLATGYAPNYILHLIFRCSVAATCSLMCIGIMIVSDITAGKYRIISICLFEQFWSIGVILLPAVSSWWKSWTTVYIAISIPTFSLIILYYWIPDSPRWLLKHNRVADAKKVLLDAANFNGKTDYNEDELDKELSLLAEEMQKHPSEPTLLSIWKGTLTFKIRLFAAHIGWSIYLMTYFALLLHVRAMGRKYLEINTIIAGTSEIIGTFIGLILILHTTQKWLWTSLLNILASIISISAIFVPDTIAPTERMMIYMATAMTAKMTVSTSLSIFITSMSEIVPKEKRKTCNYSGVTCSRTLVMIAPFIGFFVIYGQLVPQVITSVMNIFASLLVAICIQTSRTLPHKTEIVTPENLLLKA
ncbi:CLUMA_CG020669, isoform A [Clunio marinus]|uniref:CLUMA_CG020669, isoform A n=1 Tax=Clunio marinus TaxID=568069 RepID=A0A1J1J5N8_9DIPT|nr:CLUMA_CG020669, isoform A [Clunio marinus]